MTNLYACLVHERADCALDLVRNLRALDPVSPILLYNGGHDERLLDGQPELERLGAVCHPKPTAMYWGELHEFALDCMRFGLEEFRFDAMTIVDSDQMMVREGFSSAIATSFESDAAIGLLGNSTERQNTLTKVPPCVTAHQETELWLPFLNKFAGGTEKWVHWSFWPSTVFAADACRDLLTLFDTDEQLKANLKQSRLWATEEVLFPTLVSLLGYRVADNPGSYEYVKYRARYSTRQILRALEHDSVYWIHPVKRQLNDPIRTLIRSKTLPQNPGDGRADPAVVNGYTPRLEELNGVKPKSGVPLVLPLIQRMQQVDGWLEADEADLVIGAAITALTGNLKKHSVVEIGSYCGRATVLLGSIAKSLGVPSKVVAIDTFDGVVGANDDRIERKHPTLDQFRKTLDAAGIREHVREVVGQSCNVAWNEPISLLLIDGLHDYESVAADFRHFERHLRKGSLILFHDYASYYKDVKRFVDELVSDSAYERVRLVRTMMLVRRVKAGGSSMRAFALGGARKDVTLNVKSSPAHGTPISPESPLVSCIMPTYNRRAFVLDAIALFQNQSYANRELIVIDDGSDSVEDLIPPDPAYRYVRLPRRVSIGRKRNLGVEMASGQLVAHWDDDDWYGVERLALQAAEFQDRKCMVSGLNSVLFADPEGASGWCYRYPPRGRPWVYGATLMYRKDTWKSGPFRDVSEGEDTRFVWNVRRGIQAHRDRSWFVGRIHPGNTSRKRTNSSRWRPITVDEIVSETRGGWTIDRWLQGAPTAPKGNDQSEF